MSIAISADTGSRRLNVAIWIAQIALCILFGIAGVIKSFMAPEALAAMGIYYAVELPYWLLRFIGFSELAGAIGVVLPAATRIAPRLTPLAALGLVVIQVLAIGFHVTQGDLAQALPLNAVLLSLSLFVLWGRGIRVPVKAR